MAGNYLRLGGKIIDRVNIATPKLANAPYLLNRLKRMSEGIAEAELPSCNLFMTPNSLQDYPEISSAEDHFLFVRLLLNDKKFKNRICWNFAFRYITKKSISNADFC